MGMSENVESCSLSWGSPPDCDLSFDWLEGIPRAGVCGL